ncbi:MAG: molecular chaperone HtpG [Lachnospiraceae bacterium]|nr:molecular chaperone HtpG [Lachnospiraceae bacterium]
MEKRSGTLTIDSENIFPIIKKWLYSDQDIFVRELVSNGCDAVTKLKKLSLIGEYTLPDDYKGRIDVVANDKDKTLKITDNGIGMTAEEVDEYINRIAFSGATDFINTYKDKTNDDQIIGHFGLGFYSAFMVATKVTIDSLSYKEGATPVHWECDGGTEFTLSEGSKDAVGTTVTLYINEDCYEYANEYRVSDVLKKYCSFMPTEIYLTNPNKEPKKDKDGNIVVEEPTPVNDTTPLWTKNPSTCTDEEYKEFYRKVFMDYREPLFYIHLNMDYPFNLKGILYFPKYNMNYEMAEGVIKLYNNQVFIADNIKEVIPEYLLLLKGVIDCPDLPLNVSRSALQNDGFVNKISEYISKKVADKLSGLCKTDKENYEKYWDDIGQFVKYGCLKDMKFCDRMNDFILFKDLEEKYVTIPELMVQEEKKENEPENKESEDKAPENTEIKDEDKTTIYYVTDKVAQSQYINMFKANNTPAVILDSPIDTPFITTLERRNEKYKFMRIDSELINDAKEDVSEEDLKAETEELDKIFKKALGKDTVKLDVTKLKDENISSILILSEQARRMQDMMKAYAMDGMDPSMFGGEEKLTLNANNALVKFILEHKKSPKVPIFCEQLYDLALLANRPLTAEEMTRFVKRSNEIMLELSEK